MSAEAYTTDQLALLRAAGGITTALDDWFTFGQAAHERVALALDEDNAKRKDCIKGVALFLSMSHTDAEGNHYTALERPEFAVNRALKFHALRAVCPWSEDVPSERAARELLPLVRWDPDSGGRPAKKGMRHALAAVRAGLEQIRTAGAELTAENVRTVVDAALGRTPKAKKAPQTAAEKLLDLIDEMGLNHVLDTIAPMLTPSILLNCASAHEAIVEAACSLTDDAGASQATAAA